MKTKRVLIAIQDLKIRAPIVDHFISRGYNIVTSNLHEALEVAPVFLEEVNYAVIDDVTVIPEGLGLLESLQAGPYPIPTVMLTHNYSTGPRILGGRYSKLTIVPALDGFDKFLAAFMIQILKERRPGGVRRHPRADVFCPAVCEASPKRADIYCELKNVSQSGARVISQGFAPSLNQIVELEVAPDLPNQESLTIAGIVRWCASDKNSAENEFGVEFGLFNLHEQDALRILQVQMN